MNQRTITIKTNFNNKLDCECFCHIDVAPRQAIPETLTKETIIIIQTADNSHAPVKTQLIDLATIPPGKLSSALTYPSHAMDAFDFRQWMLENKVADDQPLALYIYKKVV